MNMIEAVKAAFSNYATFSGRARRSEYWWFVLFNLIVAVLLALVMGGNTLANSLWSLATLLASLAVGARRLHDIDRAGWWLLIGFIPLLGWLILIYWFATKGTLGTNRFGADPLAA